MSIVTLVSGGLDSSVMAILCQEAGLTQYPLFIDYGQRARDRELTAYRAVAAQYGLPSAQIAAIPGYGELVPSGLTDSSLDVSADAFLPARNLVFLVLGAAYASRVGANAVAIGLLDDAFSIFPDQTRGFVRQAEAAISTALGRSISVVTPLMTFSKAQVLAIARERGLKCTYSCHLGGETGCGKCVACREYIGLEV